MNSLTSDNVLAYKGKREQMQQLEKILNSPEVYVGKIDGWLILDYRFTDGEYPINYFGTDQ